MTGLAPPHARGLPLLGSALGFLRGPVDLIQRAYEAKGPVFTVSLGPKTLVCLIGPELAAEFFGQPGEVLSTRLAAKSVEPIMGEIAFPDDKAGHRRLLDALVPLVSRPYFDQHVDVMLEEAQRAVAGLPAEGRIELVSFTERLSQSIIVRCILGDTLAQTLDEGFRDAFTDLMNSFNAFLPPNLPLPRFRRRDRARAYLDRLVGAIIEERRGMAEPPDDAMQTLSTLRMPDGQYWSMKDTLDLVISVLFGGHHTTGTAMAWSIIHVVQHPEVLARIRGELQGAELTRERLSSLSYLGAAIQESGRLQPPTGLIGRVAQQDLTIGGYRIRKGWLVTLCPPVAHRMPQVFEHPDRYDPGRFLGDEGRPAHAFIGFGGGAHACIGRPFSSLATRALLATLLARVDLELVGTPVVDAKEVLRRPSMPCLVAHRAR